MPEKGPIAVKNINFIGGLTRSILPNAIIYSERKTGNVAMVVNPKYKKNLNELVGLVDLNAEILPGSEIPEGSRLGHTMLGIPHTLSDGTKIAVKVKLADSFQHWVDGINFYRAANTLNSEGVPVVDVLLATEKVVITAWSEDPVVNVNDPDWINYRNFLRSKSNEFINRMLAGESLDWEYDWELDTNSYNYRKRRDGSFISIDPLATILEDHP